MSPEQIIELFLKAAEADQKLPNTARPKALRSLDLGYVTEYADDQPRREQLSRNDVGLWEAALETIKLCEDEGQRRALWAWARSKAGGMSLAKWARTVEHVHPETASRRAKACITRIHQKFCSNRHLHNQNDMNCVLPDTPEMYDKKPTIREWRDDDAKPLRCFFDTDIAGLEYAALQHAKRRERKASKQQREAA